MDKKQDGLHFVFSLKQGKKIEGVVLNRVCISGCCFCPITGSWFQSNPQLLIYTKSLFVYTQILVDCPLPPPGYNVNLLKVCLVGSVKVGRENFRRSSGLNYVDTFIFISFVFYRELRYSKQIRDSISSGISTFLNEPSKMCIHFSGKWPKGWFLASDKAKNHSNEAKKKRKDSKSA